MSLGIHVAESGVEATRDDRDAEASKIARV
eukprot:COSAG02_NODE_28788_length_582_cov_1.086957_1_plen_29_part_01